MEKTAPKLVLCIHDLSGIGRSGLGNILPVLAAMGHQPVALPTSLLSTHTGGLGTPARADTCQFTRQVLEHYKTLNVEISCIYSGYLSDEKQANMVREAYDLWPNALKIVDPVMGDNGKLYSGISQSMTVAMRQLCRMADLVVPNATEAAMLMDEQLPESFERETAEAFTCRLAQLYPSVVVTGLPVGKNLCNCGVEKGRPPFWVQRIKVGGSYPGTGDLFGAVLTGALINGNALSAAVDLAAGFVADCIAQTPEEWDSRFGVWFEPELSRLVSALPKENF